MDKKEFKKEFAGRLLRAVEVAGYSVSRAASICDIDDTAMYAYTSPNSMRLPGAYRVRRLCEALHITADWLLFGLENGGIEQ